MKKLVNICVLLWVLPYIGKQYFPEFFGIWYIQWPAFFILSMLLPFGFAKSMYGVMEHKSHYKEGFFFLFIFLMINFSTAFGFNTLTASHSLLLASQKQQVIPENLSLDAINHEKSDTRKFVAQVIYIEFGQPITFKDESNMLVTYSPTAADKEAFEQRFNSGAEAKRLIELLQIQVTEMMYLLIWSICSFLVVVFAVFAYEHNKLNK